MLTYTFRFGIQPGEYPPGSCITDSILKRGRVSHLILDNAAINAGFCQDLDKGTLALQSSISATSVLTVIFETAV